MVDRNLPYLLPTRASLHVYPEKELTNQQVFDTLDEMDVAYEAAEDGIYTSFEEEVDDRERSLVYHVRIVPENDFILVHTHDRMNAAYLSQFAEALAPDLLEVDTAQSTGTYTLGHVHPVLTLDLVDSLLPDVEFVNPDDEADPARLECEYEGTTFRIFPDYEVVADETNPEKFHAFVDDLNERLTDRLPDSPDELAVEHLPDGWFDPVTAAYPELTDELAAIDPSADEPFTDLFESDAIAPNDASVIALETLGALIFAIHDLDVDERLAYYDAHGNTSSLLGEVFEIEGESPVNRDEFARQAFWTPDVEEGIYADRNRYLELKEAAASYEGLDLEAGQLWEFHDPSSADTATIRLVELGQLPEEEFPHLPVWIGSVEESSQESDLATGEAIVVHGENLVERADE